MTALYVVVCTGPHGTTPRQIGGLHHTPDTAQAAAGRHSIATGHHTHTATLTPTEPTNA